MKPIEPGCLCIVINDGVCGNNGKSVTAIEYLGNVPDRFLLADKIWRVDPPILWKEIPLFKSTEIAKGTDEYLPYCPEINLMRIDGDEELFKQEKERDTNINKVQERV